MTKESIFTIPNTISFYRIVMLPVIAYLALTDKVAPFAFFLVLNLIADIFDGMMARLLLQESKLGAQLDSIGDFGTYILSIYGVFHFKWNDIQTTFPLLVVFIIIYFASTIIGWVRFKKMPGMHLYSCVATAYIQGMFLISLFVFGYNFYLYAFAMVFGIIAYLEKIVILFLINEINSNTKGLYWLLAGKKKGTVQYPQNKEMR